MRLSSKSKIFTLVSGGCVQGNNIMNGDLPEAGDSIVNGNDHLNCTIAPERQKQIIKKVDAFLESQDAIGPNGKILYSKLLNFYDLTPVSSESSFTSVSPILSEHSSDSSGGYDTDDFERELKERRELKEAKKLKTLENANGNCDINKPETSDSDMEGEESDSDGSCGRVQYQIDLIDKCFPDDHMKMVIAALNEFKFREEVEKQSYQISGRQNISFNNEDVLKIDQENQRLLNKLVDIKNSKKSSIPSPDSSHPSRQLSSTMNRFKELKRLEEENLVRYMFVGFLCFYDSFPTLCD